LAAEDIGVYRSTTLLGCRNVLDWLRAYPVHLYLDYVSQGGLLLDEV
jgi:hypothetical protein